MQRTEALNFAGRRPARERLARPRGIAEILGRGVIAGAIGTAAMTLGEKIEQQITGRPNSYVPAHTWERVLRLPRRPDEERRALNLTAHWGQGLAFGVLRLLVARRGMRGPFVSFLSLNGRLALDQTLENATGVGAPPWTWPPREQVIDLVHKAVFAAATGAVADRLARG